MSYLEHEQNLENCGCPSCSLMEKYVKKYDAYVARKPYRVIEAKARTAPDMEQKLNVMEKRGYEMSAVVDTLIICRAVPPIPPSNTDVISEFAQRKEKVEKRKTDLGKNLDIPEGDISEDDFGPTRGSA